MVTDCDIAQAVIHRLLTAEARLRAQVGPRGVSGGQNDTGIGFSPSPSVFPCQYHSTAALYSLMCRLGGGQRAG
jgi:hypothetical protein